MNYIDSGSRSTRRRHSWGRSRTSLVDGLALVGFLALFLAGSGCVGPDDDDSVEEPTPSDDDDSADDDDDDSANDDDSGNNDDDDSANDDDSADAPPTPVPCPQLPVVVDLGFNSCASASRMEVRELRTGNVIPVALNYYATEGTLDLTPGTYELTLSPIGLDPDWSPPYYQVRQGSVALAVGLDPVASSPVVFSLDDPDGDGAVACGPNPDCDDTDPNVWFGAPEVCDGLDNNCDDTVDDETADLDGDGFVACEDCDDGDDGTNPDRDEVCDGNDNNCDGEVDEGFDTDGDLFTACGADGIAGTPDDDCADDAPRTFPGAPEACDGEDNDCDGLTTGEGSDTDGDGWWECLDCAPTDAAVHPGAVEVCNGIDDDCDPGSPDARACDMANQSALLSPEQAGALAWALDAMWMGPEAEEASALFVAWMDGAIDPACLAPVAGGIDPIGLGYYESCRYTEYLQVCTGAGPQLVTGERTLSEVGDSNGISYDSTDLWTEDHESFSGPFEVGTWFADPQPILMVDAEAGATWTHENWSYSSTGRSANISTSSDSLDATGTSYPLPTSSLRYLLRGLDWQVDLASSTNQGSTSEESWCGPINNSWDTSSGSATLVAHASTTPWELFIPNEADRCSQEPHARWSGPNLELNGRSSPAGPVDFEIQVFFDGDTNCDGCGTLLIDQQEAGAICL